MQAEIMSMKEQTAEIMRIVEESLHTQMQKEMKAVHEQTAEIREILQESLKSAENKAAEAESATAKAEERQKELEKQLADLNASQQDRAIELKVLQQKIASLPPKVKNKHAL